MERKNFSVFVFFFSAALLLAGCGGDNGVIPPVDQLRINPASSFTLFVDEEKTLSAVGGKDPITWTVSENVVVVAQSGQGAKTGRLITLIGKTPGLGRAEARDGEGQIASVDFTVKKLVNKIEVISVSPPSGSTIPKGNPIAVKVRYFSSYSHATIGGFPSIDGVNSAEGYTTFGQGVERGEGELTIRMTIDRGSATTKTNFVVASLGTVGKKDIDSSPFTAVYKWRD